MMPLGAIGLATTRVMLALVRVHARDGRATVRSVAEEAHRGVAVTYRHLGIFSRLGLVDGWGDGIQGALRPLVRTIR